MPTIPLRVIVLVIVVVVAAVSAIIVYFPNAKATSDAVDTLVADLRQETSNNLVALTRAQFSPVLTLAQTVIAYANLGSLNTTDGTHLKSWIPTLCALANTSAYFVRAALPNKDYVGCFAGVAYFRDPTTSNFYSGVAPPPLYPVPPVSQMTLASANFNTLAKPWYVPLKDVNAWSPFFVRTIPPAAASIAVGGPMYDSKGNKVGIISVNLDSINFLAAMLTVRVGLTGRAMVYEGTTGYYVAGNFNQSATVVTNATTGALRLTWLNETTDDLIVASMGALGGQNGLLQLPPTFEASFGLGTDTVYVDITPIQDAWGLNLRLITAIRRSDFTSDLEAQEKTVVGAVVGAVAGLAVLCGILIWLLIAPLSTLASEMNVRDTMAIDGAAAGGGARSRSALSEVAEIQDAYWALQQELQRVKSYLPQSVLRQLERRASGEEDDHAEDGDGTPTLKPRSIGSKRSSAQRSDSLHTTPSDRASHAASGALLTSMEAMLAVAKRPVSIVALNIRRFHQDILPKGETRVADFSSSFVTLIHEVSAAHRGVTHLMHGDRVFLSFNAASRVATHTTRAIQTAIAIRDRAMTQLGVTVTAGVASGEAVVGMLGNTAQRQFTVLGRVFSRAIVLERLCGHRAFLVNRAGDAPIDGVLAESSVVNAAGDTVAMRVVDVVALPQARRLQCIYTTVPPQTELPDGGQTPPANVPVEGEWMYELDRARLQNPYVSYNEAMECVAQGKHEDARGILSEMQCPSTAVKSLRDLAVERIVQLQSGSVDSVASELGPYYLLTTGYAGVD